MHYDDRSSRGYQAETLKSKCLVAYNVIFAHSVLHYASDPCTAACKMQHIQQTRPNANHYLNVYLPTMRAPCFNNKRCSQASPTATPKPKPGNRKQHGGGQENRLGIKKVRPREKCRSKPNGRRTIKLPATNPKRGILGKNTFVQSSGN